MIYSALGRQIVYTNLIFPVAERTKNMSQTIWNLFVELRKELLEAQKIRAQVLGFKVTFVATVVSFLALHLESVDKALLVIPAFAAIFFDFITCSYSFSIKRIGKYTKKHIEPALKTPSGDIPENFLMWQQFLERPETKQYLALHGNFGFTALTVGVAIIALCFPFRLWVSTVLIVILLVFLCMDALAYYRESEKL